MSNDARLLRRTCCPVTPFGTDDDMSWQSEVSWQFEPSGWHDNRSQLGAALSPWTVTSTASNTRVVRRSANDFYLSHTTSGFRSFSNPYYEHSGYEPVPSGRLELHSYVATDNDTYLVHGKYHHHGGDYGKSHYQGEVSSGRKVSSATNKDDPATIDYYTEDVERQLRTSRMIDSNPFMDDHGHHHHGATNKRFPHGHGTTHCMLVNHLDHGLQHDSWEGTTQGYGDDSRYDDVDHRYGGFGHVDKDEVEEEEEEAPKAVSLFSLFKYSTKFDMLLILLGCLGALINGGSLPWYSYLFGDFVNKIAKESDDPDKSKLMKDVEKVSKAPFSSLFTRKKPGF